MICVDISRYNREGNLLYPLVTWIGWLDEGIHCSKQKNCIEAANEDNDTRSHRISIYFLIYLLF